MPINFTAQKVAELVNGEVVGSHEAKISGIATLAHAKYNQLSFLGNNKYRPQVLNSKARIVLVPEKFKEVPPENRAWVKCSQPSEGFAIIASYYTPPEIIPEPFIHPSAVISNTATIQDSVHIGANAVIQDSAKIGDKSIIEAGCVIGQHVQIGVGCRIYPNVTIRERSLIGNYVIIHSGTVIGSDGFGYILGKDGHKKIRQAGYVQIDDDVEIGANVAIDRARFDKTWIKKGVKIDNLVQIAHNVQIGENSIIISQAGISGSVDIGKNVILAGQAGIPGHLTIGDGAVIMGKSGPLGDAEPGAKLMGIPAVPHKQFWKQVANIQKLPEMRKKIKELESELNELKNRLK